MGPEPTSPSAAAKARALGLFQAGHAAEAQALFEALRRTGGADFDVLHILGVMAAGRGETAAAEALVREALTHAPDNPEGLRNHGALLRALGRAEEALAVYRHAETAVPGAPQILGNLANLLNDLKRWDEALAAAARALAVDPTFAPAANARGNALRGLGRPVEAVAAYDVAIAAQPGHHDALANRAAALLDLGRSAAALASYDQALAAQPASPVALAGRGNALSALGRWDEAVPAYDAAFARQPGLPFLAGARLHARMKVCDWGGWEAAVADLGQRIDAGQPASTPWPLIAAPLSAMQQRRAAETYGAAMFGDPPGPAPVPPRADRIRLGYFSADLHDHATAYLMAELFELHDRAAFEITAFSFGPAADSPMRARLAAAFDHFIDVSGLSDQAVADLARQLGIDIAIDLKGFTTGARPGVFLRRPAPVRVSYLGYPGSMGPRFVDYLIADPVLIGPADRAAYAEQVAFLPDCYQPNDRHRAVAPQAGARRDHGLPDTGVVFVAFNNPYKITPPVFAVWMSLLAALPGAALWLFEDNPAAAANLRREARAHGIAPERLVFAPKAPLDAHLARMAHGDLFLDTTPCSAHTTASDALWAGLPVLTVRGETFAGRVAESLLRAMGLDEMVAPDLADYQALALALARDPARLGAIRDSLPARRAASSLFDTPTLVGDLEELYRAMHGRRLAGLPPQDIAPSR